MSAPPLRFGGLGETSDASLGGWLGRRRLKFPFDVGDQVSDCHQFLQVRIRDRQIELFLNPEHQLDRIQRIQAEVPTQGMAQPDRADIPLQLVRKRRENSINSHGLSCHTRIRPLTDCEREPAGLTRDHTTRSLVFFQDERGVIAPESEGVHQRYLDGSLLHVG